MFSLLELLQSWCLFRAIENRCESYKTGKMNGKFHCYVANYPQRERLELSIIRLLILSSTTGTSLMEMAPCLPVVSLKRAQRTGVWMDQPAWVLVLGLRHRCRLGSHLSPRWSRGFMVMWWMQRLASPRNGKKEAAGVSRMGIVYFHHTVMGKTCHMWT